MDKILTTPGGAAVPFYASCRLWFMKPKPHPTHKGAMLMRVQIKKNKAAPPPGVKEVPVTFFYGKGPDIVDEAIEFLRATGNLRHSAGVSKVRWQDDAEMDVIHPDCPPGKVACFDFVRDDLETLARLYERIEVIQGKKTD